VSAIILSSSCNKTSAQLSTRSNCRNSFAKKLRAGLSRFAAASAILLALKLCAQPAFAQATLTLGRTAINFKSVAAGTVSTQEVALKSTGSSALTVTSATVTGAGYSVSGLSFPVTIAPGTGVILNVAFDPTAAGAATGTVTFASNSSAGMATVNLMGTGTGTVSAPPVVSTLSVSSASIGFGTVLVNTPVTQSLTLASTGNAAVTISSAALTGAGFSLGAQAFPITLSAGQSATLEIEFDPTAAGAAAGQLTLASNSSTGASTVVNLSGAGQAESFQVNLNWEAPSSPNDPIAGYNVYRAANGSSMYVLVNSSMETGTSFTDATVQAGATYDYYVETVDTDGNSSAPSSTIAVTIS
jgi:hypothetical protein